MTEKNWDKPLDGIRAVAAISVLAAHTGMLPFRDAGQPGVHLFFVLSSFLLMRPFLEYGDAYTVRGIVAFYTRRVFRIFPMLIFFVLVFGSLSGSPGFIYNNLVLFQGEGHLWTINQELLFYALMPLLAFALLPLRRRPIAAASLLVALAVVSSIYLTRDVFYLPGNDRQQYFRIAAFLIGMAAAFVAPCLAQPPTRRWISDLMSLAIVAAIVLAIRYYGSGFALDLCFGALLVLLVVAPSSLASLLSWIPLRVIGLAGYSFYLWHAIPALWLLPEYPPSVRFLGCLAVTSAVAICTFFMIERPAIMLGRMLTKGHRSRLPA